MKLLNAPPPATGDTVSRELRFTTAWYAWISRLFFVSQAIGESGTTADRPTKDLYIGRSYLDSTLGKPIWVKSLNPTVWIDATGASV